MKAKLLPTTGIGSLPFEDISRAIDFSLKFDIPFLPELPKLDGDFISSFKENNNSCLEKFKERTESLPLVKYQIPSPELVQIESYGKVKSPLFIDAPTIKDYKVLKNFISSIENSVGIHCCGNFDLTEILKLKINFFSFDARLVESPRELIEELIRYNIIPVVGIVSTHEKRAQRPNNIDIWKNVIRDYPMDCWLSPACGLAGLSISECDKTLDLLLTIRNEILLAQ